LYEAAQSMLVRAVKWSWLKAWAMKIARYRGMKKAIVALARRLAVIMHRIWVDGTEFRWTREVAAALEPGGSNQIGENLRSPQRWNDVPRGTMDEVSSHVLLEPAVTLTARSPKRLFHLVFESHDGRAFVPSPKRSASP